MGTYRNKSPASQKGQLRFTIFVSESPLVSVLDPEFPLSNNNKITALCFSISWTRHRFVSDLLTKYCEKGKPFNKEVFFIKYFRRACTKWWICWIYFHKKHCYIKNWCALWRCFAGTYSMISLNVWRPGKSSLPLILGQAVLFTALLWKNFQAYSLTNKLFPAGFNIVISAAMLCFYSYVVLSGGNPPPKKLKSSASVEASVRE